MELHTTTIHTQTLFHVCLVFFWERGWREAHNNHDTYLHTAQPKRTFFLFLFVYGCVVWISIRWIYLSLPILSHPIASHPIHACSSIICSRKETVEPSSKPCGCGGWNAFRAAHCCQRVPSRICDIMTWYDMIKMDSTCMLRTCQVIILRFFGWVSW